MFAKNKEQYFVPVMMVLKVCLSVILTLLPRLGLKKLHAMFDTLFLSGFVGCARCEDICRHFASLPW